MSVSSYLVPPAESPDRAARTTALFESYQRARSAAVRGRLLDEIVELNLCVARSLAHRYRARGVEVEDLEQVAYLALVKAAHRFDPEAGHDFLAYAVPTIRGEVRRHFRDVGWTVRPPRRIQELQGRVADVQMDLAGRLGRSPTAGDLAAELGVERSEVEEALGAEGCFVPASLDRPVGESGDTTVGDLLEATDPGQGSAEARIALGPVVRRLSERDRKILRLRFFEDLTQREIGAQIGVTQMQVSRVLSRIFDELRAALEATQPDTTVAGEASEYAAAGGPA